MSNVLYLDDNAMAGSAMKGILAKVHHRCVVASTTTEAWQRLLDLVQIDLVVIEPVLQGESGLSLIKQLRSDCNLSGIPIIVYSQLSDRAAVKRTLELGIQGYFIKPFDDAIVQREVKKAADFAWRKQLFEEEKAFCAQLSITLADLKIVREELMAAMEVTLPEFTKLAEIRDLRETLKLIEPLSENAEGAGVWAIANFLQDMRTKAEEGKWVAFEHFREGLNFAISLTYCHMNPGHLSEGFLSIEELKEKEESGEKKRWLEADVKGALPLATKDDVMAGLERLETCPAMESAAAFFTMRTDGRSLTQLMDLVSSDPGLAALALIGANRIPRMEKMIVDDPRAAVSMLGEIKLGALARTIPVIAERHMKFPPFGWPEFWMFQVGTAHLAKFVCDSLELGELAHASYAVGLTHDLGKLLLASLYPFGIEAAAKYAKERSVSFDTAAKRIVGVTTREMGSHFAREQGLPDVFADVMLNVNEPEKAGDHVAMAAVVAWARYLCLHHRVGQNGEPLGAARIPIESTEAWRILRVRTFPGFDLRKFEVAAQEMCVNLKQELLGRDRLFRASKGA